MAGNDNALDQLMRILLHQNAIVESPRFALVGVDAQINWTRMILGQKRPFEPARKPSTAATTEPGVFDEVRHIARCHAQEFFDPRVTTISLVRRE